MDLVFAEVKKLHLQRPIFFKGIRNLQNDNYPAQDLREIYTSTLSKLLTSSAKRD